MSYTRNRNFITGFRCFAKGTLSAPNLTLYPASKTVRRNILGNYNPHWKTQVASGSNATTAFSGDYSSINTKRGHVTVKAHTGSPPIYSEQHMHGDLAAYAAAEPSWTGGWTSRAGSRAASEFLQDVRKAQVQWSGPTFLGEFREAVRMFTHPINALERGVTNYLDALKKANRENRRKYFNKKQPEYARNLTHIASGIWLEYAFGWTPFLRDIADSRDAYNSLFDKEQTVKISGSGKDLHQKFLSTNVQTGVLPSCTAYAYLTQRDWEEEIVRYKGAVLHRAATTATDRFARYGFTPSEFAPTAWELLPWSFLIDYFANIGDLINAEATSTADVAWCNRTVIRAVTSERTLAWSSKSIAPGYSSWTIDLLDSSPSVSVWKRKSIDRGVSGVPQPSLTFSYPRSAKRLLNCAALLAQVGIALHPQRVDGKKFRLDLTD